jgi:hypothetical protein
MSELLAEWSLVSGVAGAQELIRKKRIARESVKGARMPHVFRKTHLYSLLAAFLGDGLDRYANLFVERGQWQLWNINSNYSQAGQKFMTINEPARPTPRVFCPKVRLRKNTSVLVIPRPPSSSGPSKDRLRALPGTPESVSLPSDKSVCQSQQEES